MQIKKNYRFAIIVFICIAFIENSQAGAIKPKADIDVREIISLNSGLSIYRAIKGYSEINPYLVLEKIDEGDGEGERRVASIWRLKEINGGKQFQNPEEGDDIKDIKWSGKTLEFVYSSASGKKICIISQIIEGKPIVSCQFSKK